MFRKSYFGLLCLSVLAVAGAADNQKAAFSSEPRIVKDYVCLRDGDLCHPNFAKNRAMYVSCANGVAWEQQCGSCNYHPVMCPTKNLWFDGEKCDWASPKLATSPCVDKLPYPISDLNTPTDVQKELGLSEQELLLQSLQAIQNPIPSVHDVQGQDQNRWPSSSPAQDSPLMSGSIHFRPQKHREQGEQGAVESAEQLIDQRVERKGAEADVSEPEFPSYISPDDSKIVKLSEPVYALVNAPDGSGKQVLMRVYQPYVLEDQSRTLLPNNMNFFNPYSFFKH